MALRWSSPRRRCWATPTSSTWDGLRRLLRALARSAGAGAMQRTAGADRALHSALSKDWPVLIAAASSPWSRRLAIAPGDGGRLSLRLVGAVKGAALIPGGARASTQRLKRRPAWALANAAVFAIVLADPMSTLPGSIPFTPSSALLLGAYASIGLTPALVRSGAAVGAAALDAARLRLQPRRAGNVATAASVAAGSARAAGARLSMAEGARDRARISLVGACDRARAGNNRPAGDDHRRQ